MILKVPCGRGESEGSEGLNGLDKGEMHGSSVTLEASLTCCKTFKLAPRDKEAIYKLLEFNMRSFYEKVKDLVDTFCLDKEEIDLIFLYLFHHFRLGVGTETQGQKNYLTLEPTSFSCMYLVKRVN